MRYFLIIFSSLLFLSSFSVNASTEMKLQEDWRWVHYDKNSGLPSNHITKIIQSESGITWAASLNGLAWYDNYMWHKIEEHQKTFSNWADIRPGFGSSVILSTEGKLFKIDTNSIQRISCQFNNTELIVYEALTYESDKYMIYAKHPDSEKFGLFEYDNGDLTLLPEPEGLFKESINLKSWMAKSNDAAIWLKTNTRILKFNGKSWDPVLNIPQAGHFDIFMPDNIDDDKYVFPISFPHDFIGIWLIEDKAAKKISDHFLHYISKGHSANNEMIGIITGGRMVLISEKEVREITNFKLDKKNIYWVHFTENGDLWFGTNEGAFFCNLSSNMWRDIAPGLSKNEIINDFEILDNGDIWVAHDRGLSIYNSDGKISDIKYIGSQKLTSITSIKVDKDNNIWISSGSSFKGLYMFDGRKWSKPSDGSLLEDAWVHKISQSKDGRLWFLTLDINTVYGGYGAFYYEDGEILHFDTKCDTELGRIYSFVHASDGAYWFGGYDKIIKCKGDELEVFSDGNVIGHSGVFTMDEGPDGKIWFGNRVYSMGYIEDDSIHYDDIIDEYEVRGIWNLYFDKDSTMWISTSNGLYAYKDGIISSMSDESGLGSINIWPVKRKGNILYIGTLGAGMRLLDISEYKHNKLRFRIDEIIEKERAASIFYSVFSENGLIPKHDIKCRYKIDDGHWSEWKSDKFAHFYNLSGGEHRVTIQANSSALSSYIAETMLVIDIPLPYYRRIEFIIPVFLIVTISLVALMNFRLYLNKKKAGELIEAKNEQILNSKYELEQQNEEIFKKNQELEELNNVKNKLFSVVSHDMKNPISSLILSIGLLQMNEEVKKSEYLTKKVDSIDSSLRRLSIMFENLLKWARSQTGQLKFSPMNVDLESLVNNVLNVTNAHIESKKIKIIKEVSCRSQAYVDINLFETAVRNILYNCVKYTDYEGEIKITCLTDEYETKLSIKDNGIGMSPEQLDKLYNIGKTSVKGTANEPGTGLGIIISKEFIEKHNGRLEVKSKLNEGSEFIITIPKP